MRHEDHRRFAKASEAAIHELKRFVIGQDPMAPEQHSIRLWRDFYTDGGQIHGAALSGIEYACWDITGVRHGQRVLWRDRAA